MNTVIDLGSEGVEYKIAAHPASGWGIVISRNGEEVMYLAGKSAHCLRDWLCERYGDPRKTLWQRLTRRAVKAPPHY